MVWILNVIDITCDYDELWLNVGVGLSVILIMYAIICDWD